MRVPRTFSFVDLSGFTNYTAAFGDDAAGRILSAFRSLVREIASERGVRIAKWLGDGCMVVSIEQSNAVAFALDLEHKSAEVCAPLSLRVGMATGHALLFEGDDYIGSAVNMAARLCDAAGPFEVLMPTMQIERLPRGVTANAHEPVELRGFPGPIDVVELGGQPELVASTDTGELWTRSPFRVIRTAVVPHSRLDRALFHEDLVLLKGLGASSVRITLDWSWLQPKAGAFDGDAVEWYAGLLQHSAGLGIALQFTMLERAVPQWFDNDGGFTDARFAGHWWPRWVEGVSERFGDAVSGWVPFDNPLAYANRVVPDDPRRHGDVLDTLVVAWRDAYRILRGGPPVSTAIGVKTVRPEDQTIQAAEAARRQEQLRWNLWLDALHDGTISIPGRADRELADLAGSCDVLGIVVADVDESLGAVLRTAEMGPDRPLAITLITPPGRDAERVTVVERFETACGEAAEGAPLQAMGLSPTFDIEGHDDGVITRDRDVKDSAATFFGAAVQ